MSLSIELKNFLQKKGATEVGYADITNFSPKQGLNSGVVFYITYPKEIIRNRISNTKNGWNSGRYCPNFGRFCPNFGRSMRPLF